MPKSATSNEASGHRRALEDPEFIVLGHIFVRVDILYNEVLSEIRMVSNFKVI